MQANEALMTELGKLGPTAMIWATDAIIERAAKEIAKANAQSQGRCDEYNIQAFKAQLMGGTVTHPTNEQLQQVVNVWEQLCGVCRMVRQLEMTNMQQRRDAQTAPAANSKKTKSSKKARKGGA